MKKIFFFSKKRKAKANGRNCFPFLLNQKQKDVGCVFARPSKFYQLVHFSKEQRRRKTIVGYWLQNAD